MSKLYLTLSLIILAAVFCGNVFSASNDNRIIGVKIYEYPGNKEELIKTWKATGINTVFASTALLSDSEFKKYTKENNIKTFVILPFFFDEEALSQDSALYAITSDGKPAKEDWVKFVCPSNENFINRKIQYIKKFVLENNPDGISLDFIRHFVYWEMVYPDTKPESLPNTCFDEKCISGFCKSLNITQPSDVKTAKEIYLWIQKNYFNQWVDYKCSLVTNTVKRIVEEVRKIKPGILVNLHIVPWRRTDYNGAIKNVAGQDIKALAEYADYISPMTYSHMVKREPSWIHSVAEDMNVYKSNKVLPSVQVGRTYTNDEYPVSAFRECIMEALKAPSAGVVFWNWNALSEDKEKLKAVKELISK
jgi:hypothetical protein